MRTRRAVLVAAVAAVAVWSAGVARAGGPSAWEVQMLDALRAPPDHPRRVMLVFPLVEKGSQDGAVGWGRGLIALQAMWRSSFAPDRLLDTWDNYMASFYADQQMVGPGRTVTPMKIENTCATFECPDYVTGTLAMDGGFYKAELTFRGEQGEQQKTYIGPREEIYKLPCAIAQDVVAYLGVEPTPEQRAALSEPPLTSSEQFDRVASRYHCMTEGVFYPGQSRLDLLGKGRTQWTEDFVLWEPFYHGEPFSSRVAELPALKDRLIVRLLWARAYWIDARDMQSKAARVEPGEGPPDMAPVREAWKRAASQLAPLLGEDPYNPLVLGMMARAVGNAGYDELQRAACKRYIEVFGDGVLAHMFRGTMLLDEAWDARGPGYVGTVTPQGWQRHAELLPQAAADLDEAAKMEPRAWPVQRERIWLATSMGRPRWEAEAACQAATDACPTDVASYWNMLWYLQPKWYGTAPELLEEARHFAAIGDPQAAIPRLLAVSYWQLGGYADKDDRMAATRKLLSAPGAAQEVMSALERCIRANPDDYTSQSLLLAVAYWNEDHDRVLKLLESLGDPQPNALPERLDERYVNRYFCAEVRDWLDRPDSSALMVAARTGSLSALESALAAGADVNKARSDGTTALLLAAHCAHSPAVERLLEAGADPNVKDKNGDSALHLAARHNWPELVPLMLAHDADANALDNYGWAPLHYAVYYNYPDVAQVLLKHGADANVAARPDGRTPLHIAAAEGRTGLMDMLVKAGADPNRKTKAGGTPLYNAMARGQQQAVEWLLAHGAKSNEPSEANTAALAYAAWNGQTQAVKTLLAHGASPDAADDNGVTALQRCAQVKPSEPAAEQAVTIAGELLKAGAAVDARDRTNRTALIYAAESGSLPVLKLLLAHGATVDAAEDSKWTALHYAARLGHAEEAKALLDAGADLSLRDKDGTPPLHKCAYADSGGPETAALLIERGADLGARDRWQTTALHAAASQGKVEMARLLLDHGADIEARQQSGRTPLWAAASAGQVEMVRFLASKGADLNAADQWDLTPLHAAAEKGQTEAARALLDLGADPKALNNDKLTPADIAEKKDHPAVAALLRKAAAALHPAAGG